MISIVISNFNKSKFLKKTIESCLNQQNKNFEIIFFDDKSTDNSLTIANNLLKKSKLKYKIINRNKKKDENNSFNQMSAIKISLNYCKGSYISLLDADDLFINDKIKNIHKLIKKYKKKIIYNSYYNLEDRKFLSNKRHFKIRKFLLPIFPPTSCITIEKTIKKIIENVSFKQYPTCWLDFRIAVYSSKYLTKEILYSSKKMTVYRKISLETILSIITISHFYFWKRKLEAFFYLTKFKLFFAIFNNFKKII